MVDLADDHYAHYALDIQRAEKSLDWRPNRSLRKTLPNTVAALKQDPVDWYRKNELEPPSWLEDYEPADS